MLQVIGSYLQTSRSFGLVAARVLDRALEKFQLVIAPYVAELGKTQSACDRRSRLVELEVKVIGPD